MKFGLLAHAGILGFESIARVPRNDDCTADSASFPFHQAENAARRATGFPHESREEYALGRTKPSRRTNGRGGLHEALLTLPIASSPFFPGPAQGKKKDPDFPPCSAKPAMCTWRRSMEMSLTLGFILKIARPLRM